jgi:hypothetical protein
MIWYMLVNKGSLISGKATVTEYIPEGQTFSSADVIYAEKAGGYFVSDLWVVDNNDPSQKTKLGEDSAEYQYFKNNNLFNDASDRGNQLAYTGDKADGVYVENIEYGTWTDNNGKTGQKVTITLNGLKGYESFLKDGSVSVNGKSNGGGANWDGRGKFTLRVKTRLSGDDLMAISSGSGTVSKEYTNKAVFSQGDTYIRGAESSATGKVSKVEDLLTKAAILQEGPAYAEYSLDVNPTSQNLMANENDPVTVYDVMSSNMALATDHVVQKTIQRRNTSMSMTCPSLTQATFILTGKLPKRI